MVDLIKQLNTEFCKELNGAWIKAVSETNEKEVNFASYGEIKDLVYEARDQGYVFKLDYSPDNFIKERILGKNLESEFCSLDAWNKVLVVKNMIEQCERNQWDFIQPQFEELQRQHMKSVMLQYAIKCSGSFGPFFAGPENDTINVFGFCGSITREIVLMTLLYARK